MTNIVILAAGPPKLGRQRHLEMFKGEPLITRIINACTIENTNLYIVIHKNNSKLLDYIKNSHNNVKILLVHDEYIKTTMLTALSVEGDCINICGDLINLEKKDVKKFIKTPYDSALCRYKTPWGPNIQRNGLIRRADIGDCIIKISEKQKKEFFDEELWKKSEYFLKRFYPTIRIIDRKSYNYIGTHVNYAFFYNIWGNPNNNSFENKGTVYFNKKVYADND